MATTWIGTPRHYRCSRELAAANLAAADLAAADTATPGLSASVTAPRSQVPRTTARRFAHARNRDRRQLVRAPWHRAMAEVSLLLVTMQPGRGWVALLALDTDWQTYHELSVCPASQGPVPEKRVALCPILPATRISQMYACLYDPTIRRSTYIELFRRTVLRYRRAVGHLHGQDSGHDVPEAATSAVLLRSARCDRRRAVGRRD